MSFAPTSEVPENGLHLIDYVLIRHDDRVLLEKRLQPDFLAGEMEPSLGATGIWRAP